jgi:hypothetical protein
MTTALRLSTLTAACVLFAAGAGAQTTSPSTTSPSQTPTTDSEATTRPATTTFHGDTGIWFVPTAEVLAKGTWSVSAYRRGTNWIQGYTNVADFAGTFGYGIKERAEIFGSFLVDTRIDRDLYPLFVADPSFGGLIDRYPRVNQHWTGDNIGDLYLGAKINLWSEYRQKPAAIAVRGMVKLPTGKMDVGVSTGKPDFSLDLIVSKEAAKLVEVSGYGGYEFRGRPEGIWPFSSPTTRSAFRDGKVRPVPQSSAPTGRSKPSGRPRNS